MRREGARLVDVLVELFEESLLALHELLLGAISLGLEPLVALGHLGLDLGRPEPRVADERELLRLEATRLLGEEAKRLARLVELAVELDQSARRGREELLELDHLVVRGRVVAKADEDLHVPAAQLVARREEGGLD